MPYKRHLIKQVLVLFLSKYYLFIFFGGGLPPCSDGSAQMSMSATKLYRTSKRTCFFLWLTQYDQNDLNKKSKPRPKTTNGDKPQYEWAYHYIWSAQNLGIKWMFKKVITKSVPQSAHSKQYYVISLSTGHQTIWLFIGYVEPLWYDIWWCSSLWLGIFI